MTDKLNSFVAFCKRHRILTTIALIIVFDIVVIVASYFALGVFTNHGNKETVPNLTGMDIDKATEMLSRRNLNIEISDSSYVANVKPGCVLEQNPAAGSFVKDGRTIYVTIRTYSTKLIKLPSLTDMSVRQGESVLRSAGVKSIRIRRVPSEFQDLVLQVLCNGNSVQDGGKIPVDAEVTLVVGDGSLNGVVEEDLSGNDTAAFGGDEEFELE